MLLLQFLAIFLVQKKKIEKLEKEVNELSKQNKRIIQQNDELLSFFSKKELIQRKKSTALENLLPGSSKEAYGIDNDNFL